MLLKLQNALSNKVDSVLCSKAKEIKFFACGPTVYDFIHIGNIRPNIVADLIIRVITFQEVKVNFMQNITDIDDKIIKKALLENKTEREISAYYMKDFIWCLNKMNLTIPYFYKVSVYIKSQISFIKKLISLNTAYLDQNQQVYFNTSSFTCAQAKNNIYGQLSNRKIKDQKSVRLIGKKDGKKNKFDFVLWKKTPFGISFPSPWGEGRPGWHTECATLNSIHFHNQTIDLHLGGTDLKFPHHENERIQYYAVTKKELAKVWIYNGHVNIEGSKISKSKGNHLPLSKLLKQDGSNALKLFFYTTRYTNPIQFSHDALQNAKKINTFLKKGFQKISLCFSERKIKTISTMKISQVQTHPKITFSNEWVLVLEALKNNLNTASAITILYQLTKLILQTSGKNIPRASTFILIANNFLGLSLQEWKK